jgi:hypothetical protein
MAGTPNPRIISAQHRLIAKLMDKYDDDGPKPGEDVEDRASKRAGEVTLLVHDLCVECGCDDLVTSRIMNMLAKEYVS